MQACHVPIPSSVHAKHGDIKFSRIISKYNKPVVSKSRPNCPRQRQR